MQLITQSEATAGERTILVKAVSMVDGKTGITGIAPGAADLRISKAGGATANSAGTWTELANGWYTYLPTTGEVGTLGILLGYLTPAFCQANNIDELSFQAQVVALDLSSSTVSVGSIAGSVLNEIADAILKRDWTAVTGEAARSCLNAFRFLRNKWTVAAGTLTVTKEDDAATAWTAAVTSDAAANNIIGSDPA